LDQHPDIVSELSGNVRATKSPGGEIELTGRIDVVRGWVSFQGRRFQLARGRIEFTGGPKIDPALDIVAQYRLPQYQVEAIIGGTAAKPSLTLASQPRLEQADILSLVVFGKPIDSLDRNEQGSLQQSALSIASGYAAGRIANSVSEALGQTAWASISVRWTFPAAELASVVTSGARLSSRSPNNCPGSREAKSRWNTTSRRIGRSTVPPLAPAVAASISSGTSAIDPSAVGPCSAQFLRRGFD
jgi:hypothetical protein